MPAKTGVMLDGAIQRCLPPCYKDDAPAGAEDASPGAFYAPVHIVLRATDDAVAAHLAVVWGCDGNGDGVVMDISPDVIDKVHVSAFLSLFCLTTNHCGSALRLTPARDPRSGKAGTLFRPMPGHGD